MGDAPLYANALRKANVCDDGALDPARVARRGDVEHGNDKI